MSATGSLSNPRSPRHAAFVRITHWLTFLAFLALLVTGVEILISHPRFYWGEVGNVNTTPLFTLPIPSSRGTIPTAYKFVMPDQNGWSRYLHFHAAWLAVLTGLFYVAAGFTTRHFRNNLLPAPAQRTWHAFWSVLRSYLHRTPPQQADARTYNVAQRIAYLSVIFILFPLVIWTGLAMSPSFTSAFPIFVTALGGKQSARTLHFFVSNALLLFVIVHVVMVIHAGFRSRLRAMITGQAKTTQERP